MAATTLFQIEKRVTETTSHWFRIKIWVSAAYAGIPPEIFVWQRLPSYPGITNRTDHYVQVCSYADMLNYPAVTPNNSTLFFRRRWIDRTYRSMLELQTFWETVQTGIQALVLDISETTEAASTVTNEDIS